MVRSAGTTVVVAVLMLLGGCMVDSDSMPPPSSDDRQRYVAVGGSVDVIPAESRGEPVALSGTTLQGDHWSVASVSTDQVILVSVWGSWCDTCRTQLGELQGASDRLHAEDVPVQVVGLDFMESADDARRFQFQHALDFLTLRDDGGTVVQAVLGGGPKVPTTLVLDRSRRIAVRVVGGTDADTLTQLARDVQRAG